MIKVSGSKSILLTNGSGSGSRRPKNIRIQRIRIRNTDLLNIKIRVKYRRTSLFFLFFVQAAFIFYILGRAAAPTSGKMMRGGSASNWSSLSWSCSRRSRSREQELSTNLIRNRFYVPNSSSKKRTKNASDVIKNSRAELHRFSRRVVRD